MHVARQLHALPRAVFRRRGGGILHGRGVVGVKRRAAFGIEAALRDSALNATADRRAVRIRTQTRRKRIVQPVAHAPFGHARGFRLQIGIHHGVVRAGAGFQVVAHGLIADKDVAVAGVVRRARGLLRR